MAGKKRQVRKTLLVVGEGDTEQAFLKHLRSLYCSGGAGVNVTVRNAQGKGPQHVIDYADRQARIYSYDTCVALLDTDIPWTERLKKEARKAKIGMVGSKPCFEGLLLSILGQRLPERSEDCKIRIKQLLDIDLMRSENYVSHFSMTVLADARTTIQALDTLLSYFEGKNSPSLPGRKQVP